MPDSRKVLVLYYAATLVFLVLDYAVGLNLRLAFLDSAPVARAAYYGVCFLCLALMLWRPAWTVFIGAFESTRLGWGVFVQAPDREVYWTVRNMERSTLTWAGSFRPPITGVMPSVKWPSAPIREKVTGTFSSPRRASKFS